MFNKSKFNFEGKMDFFLGGGALFMAKGFWSRTQISFTDEVIGFMWIRNLVLAMSQLGQSTILKAIFSWQTSIKIHQIGIQKLFNLRKVEQ